MRLTARVPATAANLGPGFDSFGLALSLFNEITIDTDAEPGVTIEGEGADELPRDDSNLVLRSMQRLADRTAVEVPPLSISCRNRIPLERGLGSSASAVIGGLMMADRVLRTKLDPSTILTLAVDLEGHADNAAAALHGGIVVAYRSSSTGTWQAEPLDPDPSLRPVALVPEGERVSTAAARSSLPEDVLLEAATFNSTRAALLVLALTSRPELLAEALRDDLHQAHRLALAPSSEALFERLQQAGVPVCVAGSGPALLAFETGQAPVPDPGAGWSALRLEVEREGATVLEEGPSGR